jgi:hypothetical protein
MRFGSATLTWGHGSCSGRKGEGCPFTGVGSEAGNLSLAGSFYLQRGSFFAFVERSVRCHKKRQAALFPDCPANSDCKAPARMRNSE